MACKLLALALTVGIVLVSKATMTGNDYTQRLSERGDDRVQVTDVLAMDGLNPAVLCD
jgi:hypothetical protein